MEKTKGNMHVREQRAIESHRNPWQREGLEVKCEVVVEEGAEGGGQIEKEWREERPADEMGRCQMSQAEQRVFS